MQDFVYVVAMPVLTSIAVLFIMACNKMIGPDDEALTDGAEDEAVLRS
jgi:hypothetical protein